MNSIHDMGGMTCFGPVVREENEPLFHAPWERRGFAMTMGMGRRYPRRLRHAIEPWTRSITSNRRTMNIGSLLGNLVEHGVITPEELLTEIAQTTSIGSDPPFLPKWSQSCEQGVSAAGPRKAQTALQRWRHGESEKPQSFRPYAPATLRAWETRSHPPGAGHLSILTRMHGDETATALQRLLQRTRTVGPTAARRTTPISSMG
jgi:nitrile hydratase